MKFCEDSSFPFLDSTSTAVSNFVIIQNLEVVPDKVDLLPAPLKVFSALCYKPCFFPGIYILSEILLCLSTLSVV